MPRILPAPIRIDLGFSQILAGYLLAAHLSALFLVIALDLEIFLSCGLFVLIILSLFYYWQRDLSRSRDKSVIGIDWDEARGWLLRFKNGDALRTVHCPSSFISRYIVILYLKLDGSVKRKITIPSDAVNSDQFRRLRVLLRTHHHFGE